MEVEGKTFHAYSIPAMIANLENNSGSEFEVFRKQAFLKLT